MQHRHRIHSPTSFILYSSLSLHHSYFSLPPSLPGEMACASSTQQRKPKTRGILLKGVSQQPDINNLHVCRAESNPLGICGFTCLCVCVIQHLPHVCSIHLHVSCLLFVPLSILDFYDTRSVNCGSIEPNLHRHVFALYIFLINRQRAFLSFITHMWLKALTSDAFV